MLFAVPGGSPGKLWPEERRGGLPQMRARIERYRRDPIGEGEVEIGSRAPFFFENALDPGAARLAPKYPAGKGIRPDDRRRAGAGMRCQIGGADQRRRSRNTERPITPISEPVRCAQLVSIDGHGHEAVPSRLSLPALQAHIRPVTQGGLHQMRTRYGFVRTSTRCDHGYVTREGFRVSRRLHRLRQGEHYAALEDRVGSPEPNDLRIGLPQWPRTRSSCGSNESTTRLD